MLEFEESLSREHQYHQALALAGVSGRRSRRTHGKRYTCCMLACPRHTVNDFSRGVCEKPSRVATYFDSAKLAVRTATGRILVCSSQTLDTVVVRSQGDSQGHISRISQLHRRREMTRSSRSGYMNQHAGPSYYHDVNTVQALEEALSALPTLPADLSRPTLTSHRIHGHELTPIWRHWALVVFTSRRWQMKRLPCLCRLRNATHHAWFMTHRYPTSLTAGGQLIPTDSPEQALLLVALGVWQSFQVDRCRLSRQTIWN